LTVKSRYNLAIIGITGLENRGVEALILSTLAGFHAVSDRFDYTILTGLPIYDRARLPAHIKVVADGSPSFAGKSIAGLRSAMSALIPGAERRVAAMRQAMKDSDLVIVSGGDMYTSDYGWNSLHRNCELVAYAQRLGKPVYFIGQSIGRFSSQRDADEWLRVARASRKVILRESRSRDYVVNELGLPENLTLLAADSAFLLQPPSPEKVDAMFAGMGLDPSRPTVALAPSQGIVRYGRLENEPHDAAWQQLIAYFTDELSSNVLLVPHVHTQHPLSDDREISTRLWLGAHGNPLVRLVPGELGADEYKGLIGRCTLVLAERMHAAIAGLSSGVCTMPVKYSIKAEGIINDCLGQDLLDRCVINLDTFMDPARLKAQIATVWPERKQIAESLQRTLPEIQNRARLNYTTVAEDFLARAEKA
jgi:colanic acid/amylovoran biosynthesis protein